MKKNNNYLICNWILDPTQLTQMTQIFFVETKLTTYLQHFSIFKQDGARKPVLTLFTLFVFHVECQIFDWQILIQYFKSNSMHSLTSKDWQITDFSAGNTIYKCSIFTSSVIFLHNITVHIRFVLSLTFVSNSTHVDWKLCNR